MGSFRYSIGTCLKTRCEPPPWASSVSLIELLSSLPMNFRPGVIHALERQHGHTQLRDERVLLVRLRGLVRLLPAGDHESAIGRAKVLSWRCLWSRSCLLVESNKAFLSGWDMVPSMVSFAFASVSLSSSSDYSTSTSASFDLLLYLRGAVDTRQAQFRNVNVLGVLNINFTDNGLSITVYKLRRFWTNLTNEWECLFCSALLVSRVTAEHLLGMRNHLGLRSSMCRVEWSEWGKRRGTAEVTEENRVKGFAFTNSTDVLRSITQSIPVVDGLGACAGEMCRGGRSRDRLMSVEVGEESWCKSYTMSSQRREARLRKITEIRARVNAQYYVGLQQVYSRSTTDIKVNRIYIERSS